MTKTQVAILFGGRSVEHDISLLSARNIVENLDAGLFEPLLVGISRQGRWHLCRKVEEPEAGAPLQVLLDAGRPVFSTAERSFTPDVVFPVLHGTDGEDGSVQGLLQVLNLPCVGSGVAGSAVAMDKLLTKRVLEAAELPVAPYLALSRAQQWPTFATAAGRLGVPFIAKPANLGSSVGVNKVAGEKDYLPALEEAFTYDHTVLLETFINGREVECAILGNDEPIASVAGEIVLAEDHPFYSFAAKYEDPEAARILVPAAMPEAVHNQIKDLSLQAFRLLNCADLARVDLFVTDTHRVYINEVNTIPGFTNISMYPMLMQHEGIGYRELLTRLIELARERHRNRNRLSTDYKLRT